ILNSNLQFNDETRGGSKSANTRPIYIQASYRPPVILTLGKSPKDCMAEHVYSSTDVFHDADTHFERLSRVEALEKYTELIPDDDSGWALFRCGECYRSESPWA